MRGVQSKVGHAALAALLLSTAAASRGSVAARPPPLDYRPAEAFLPVQARTTPELRARALVRQFPWIVRFWAELRSEERARVERAFRRRGQTNGLETAWDRMGLQDRVLLLFGPGRAAARN